jgi:aspartyl-tRNA(Asn)/glutamyl-tRNA(Gln) amidotransferase subunit A
MRELLELSACELMRRYAARSVSPVEVVQAAVRQLSAVNPVLNIFYLLREEPALAEARLSEQRWLRGEPVGLLDGVPTSVKDGLAMMETPMYRGSAAFDPTAVISATDAPCVARLRQHGAIILGKTTMPDLGILASGYSSKHGVTRNPWNVAYNTGGSSSGAAASLASCINPIAVGTDIVGSIRLPASFCGLVGFKPSQFRVPYYFPHSPALVAGPMARTVEDAGLLMTVICEPDQRDFTAMPYERIEYQVRSHSSERAKIGFLPRMGWDESVDEEVSAAVRRAVQTFEEMGHEVIELPPPCTKIDLQALEAFYRVRTLTELSRYPEEVQAKAHVIKRWSDPARTLTARELYQSYNHIQFLRERIMQVFSDIDFMLLPSVHVLPYRAELPGVSADDVFSPWGNCLLFNVTEQPAVSINCGFSASGLPIGLQIVGRRFDDRGVFRMARDYESVTEGVKRWPIETGTARN